MNNFKQFLPVYRKVEENALQVSFTNTFACPIFVTSNLFTMVQDISNVQYHTKMKGFGAPTGKPTSNHIYMEICMTEQNC